MDMTAIPPKAEYQDPSVLKRKKSRCSGEGLRDRFKTNKDSNICGRAVMHSILYTCTICFINLYLNYPCHLQQLAYCVIRIT